MNIGDIRMPHVIVTHPATPLAEAARMMRKYQVGALVVLDPRDPNRHPVGMLTDRDVVVGQLEKQADLHCLTVEDVMTPHPLALAMTMDLGEAIEAMNSRAVRRAPVVDAEGALAGIVTLDDIVPAVAREIGDLAAVMDTQSRSRPDR
jgi:CBS domain-containing protein